MSENLKSILFINKQYLECKINYEDFENKYYLTSFYVKIDDEWILTKKEKIKKTRFDNVINTYKLTYEYLFNDFHIEFFGGVLCKQTYFCWFFYVQDEGFISFILQFEIYMFSIWDGISRN